LFILPKSSFGEHNLPKSSFGEHKLLKNIREAIEAFKKPGGNMYDHPVDVYWYSIQNTDSWHFLVSPALQINLISDIRGSLL